MALQDNLARIVEVVSGANLRPAYPPVALDLASDAISLVRFKAGGRGTPLLEAHVQRRLESR